jgi:hypothetical protein
MVESCLKYGFLTTYNETLFLRRTDRYKFEISPPIHFEDVNTTVRQCFLYMSKLCSAKDCRIEDPTFYGQDVTQILFRDASGLINSQRTSPGRIRNFQTGGFPVSRSTTVIGTDEANFPVTIKERLARRVFKVDLAGQTCILKHWHPEEEVL